MKTHKVILTDVDGVLLNFIEQLIPFLKDKYGVHTTSKDWEKHYFLSDLIDIPRAEAKKIMIDFTHSDYFKDIPVHLDAEKVVKQMADEGWRFIAVTAANQNCDTQDIERVYQSRLYNLEKHFGSIFDELHLTNMMGCKSDTLKKFKPSYWLEDSVKNASIGHELGHHSIIMKSHYYSEEENNFSLPVVESWDSLFSYVKNYEQK